MAIHIKELHVRVHGGEAHATDSGDGQSLESSDSCGPVSNKGMSEQAIRKTIAEEVRQQLARLKRR